MKLHINKGNDQYTGISSKQVNNSILDIDKSQ